MNTIDTINLLQSAYQFKNVELMSNIKMRSENIKYFKGQYEDQTVWIKASTLKVMQGTFENEYKNALKCWSLCPQNFIKPLCYKDFSETNFIAMEFCDGNKISKDTILKLKTENDRVFFAKQFEEIANTLFTTNIVHRDIRPDNIMVTKDNIIKLIDLQLGVNYLDYKEVINPYSIYSLGSSFKRGFLKYDDFYSLSKVMNYLKLQVPSSISKKIGKHVLVVKNRFYYIIRINIAKFICLFIRNKLLKQSVKNKILKI